MIQRYTKLAFALALAMMVGACHHNNVSNPIANVNSKQPDKVLFDRAMDAMKHGKYDVARITLQTLINTYPDSEFIARAKLAVGDSWYAEGSAASYQQAEVEYKDFETFFPNMPEAAEAQLRIADMHYKQMEKADRDYTHAMRAEDEYRVLIQQYPDNTKLVPIAKQRLREVQEVLGERQYRIGRFYYLREAYPAAIARLKTLTDTYPLYSQADDALMMLGQAYEDEARMIKNSKMVEGPKARLVKQYEANATEVYSRLIQRYPAGNCAGDARSHLKDLGQPIPTPTKEAIAQNKAEIASRSEMGHLGSFMSTFHKAPDDLVRASKVGEPILVDPQPTSAPEIIRAATGTALGLPGAGNGSVNLENAAAPGTLKNEAVPRSDAAAGTNDTPAAGTAAPTPAPAASAGSNAAPAASAPPTTPPAAPSTNSEQAIGDLTPNVPPTTTQAAASAPTAAGATDNTAASGAASTGAEPPQAPPQVNEIQSGTSSSSSSSASAATDTASSSASDEGSSSSKKKKKKGLKKLNPF